MNLNIPTLQISGELDESLKLPLTKVRINNSLYIALWDTGANRSCVDFSVLQNENIIQKTDKLTCISPNGEKIEQDVYAVQVQLTPDTEAIEMNLVASALPNTHIIIGMDIISQGTFVMNNYSFTFAYPPITT